MEKFHASNGGGMQDSVDVNDTFYGTINIVFQGENNEQVISKLLSTVGVPTRLRRCFWASTVAGYGYCLHNN
jgi:hypothetical protein